MTAAREAFADEVRGFALLGIVLVNAPFIVISSAGYTAAAVAAPPDRVAAFWVAALAQGKFYLLFATMFGYSFTLALRGDQASGLQRHRRRLLGLAVLGVVHAVTLFIGDILLSYAIFGLTLPALLRRSDRAVARMAGVAVAVAVLVLVAIVWLIAADPAPLLDPTLQRGDHELRTRGFVSAVPVRAALWPSALALLAVLNWPLIFACFCVGLLAGRRRLLADPGLHADLWRRMRRVGLGVGLPAGLGAAWLQYGPGRAGADTELDLRAALGVALGFLSAPALTAGYLGALAGLRARWPAALAWLRPAGRMSLTGYLGESLLLAAFACGWGLGRLGTVGAAHAALLALGVWLTLECFAHLWQRRFAHGPAEHLLRRWTHRPGKTSP